MLAKHMIFFEVASEHAASDEPSLAMDDTIIPSEYLTSLLNMYRFLTLLNNIMLHPNSTSGGLDINSSGTLKKAIFL